MKKRNIALLTACIVLASGCNKTTGVGGTASDATAQTLKVNAQFSKNLKLEDQQDFEDAKRGFIARPSGKILAADGSVLHDFDAYTFEEGNAPDPGKP